MYVDARYVSSPEAFWYLSTFKMNVQSHVIFRLKVHLQGQQSVYFLPGLEEEALNWVAVNNSHITAWFDLNINVDHARTILYKDIPNFYKCEKDMWKRGG